MSEWVIYLLVGIGITILICCIFWLSKSRSGSKDSFLDYYNAESYLKTLPNTLGRYVRFRPSLTSGDGYMNLCAVTVFDINGNDISTGKKAYATSSYNSSGEVYASASAVLSGSNRTCEKTAAWQQQKDSDPNTTYWEVDLGSVQQISQVMYFGREDCCQDRGRGVRVQILLTNEVNPPASSLVAEKQLPTNAITQTVIFTNSFVFSPPSITAQGEVYYLTGNPGFTQPQAEAACNIYGATLASVEQLRLTDKNGGSWGVAGWVKDSGQPIYPQGGLKYGPPLATTGANCFGIKPPSGLSSAISPFNASGWSQYSPNMPSYYGDTTITIPDIITMKDKIALNIQAAYLDDKTAVAPQVDQNPDTGAIISLFCNAAPGFYCNDGSIVEYPCPPGAFCQGGRFRPITNNNAVAAPLNYINDTANLTGYGQTISVQIFGIVSPIALAEIQKNLDLAKQIYLGSDTDVDKFLNVAHDDLQPYYRGQYGYNYCKTEIEQIIEQGNFKIILKKESQNSNRSYCNVPITSTTLSLLSHRARKYVITWIYNRTQRIINFKSANAPDLPAKLAAVQYMVPTSPPIDITQKYTLDSIAQKFYETMQGMYKMSYIYDVFTVGNTILDVRFDMTKHADISPMAAKIGEIRAKYLAVRASNVTQDILDSAKSSYQEAVASIQQDQIENELEPQVGMVARFFYTVTNGSVNITGFTLDSRAVTSFIPEMNCGLQTPMGSDDGNVNYEPVTVYTKNIPTALLCNDPIIVRGIIEDYLDASVADLQETLKNDAISVDTDLGSIQVSQILGALQVSPTQCALKWVETLYDLETNLPVAPATTNITRRAIFSYTPNTTDWYGTDTTFDASGFAFYKTDTVPACVFNPTYYVNQSIGRLATLNPAVAADLKKIREDFLTNVFSGPNPTVCPDIIPNYKFNPLDYLAAYPDFGAVFNNGGSGPADIPALKNHYILYGNSEGRMVRAAQAIPALSPPITISKPMPAEFTLDDAGGACPAVSCDDPDVLYGLVEQYNSDPELPGSILRVTRAFTPNANQCDVEVDINYDAMVTDDAGKEVRKGAAKLPKWGSPGRWVRASPGGPYYGWLAWLPSSGKYVYPVSSCSPCPGLYECLEKNWIPHEEFASYTIVNPGFNCNMLQFSGIVQNETLAFTVGMDPGTCKLDLYDSSGSRTGTSIQANTPALYKPMEYAAQFQKVTSDAVTASINAITSAAGSAAAAAGSILPSYRINTLGAAGDIQYLGTCPTVRCGDPTILGAMTAYYKTQNLRVKQINTIQKVGTSTSNTCDITYQEDTLVAGANGASSIQSSQTAGMRFTVVPVDATPANKCNFKVTGMTSILPTPPAATINDTAQPINVASTLKPGFLNGSFIREPISGYIGWQVNGTNTVNPVVSWNDCTCNGINVCNTTEVTSAKLATMTTGPRFNCSMLTFINPTKEAFGDYSSIRVSESTYPLNASAFGLDKARNKAKTELKELYKEPLYQSADVEVKPGSLAALKSKETPSMPAYKYIRFRPVETRVADAFNVAIGRITLYLDGQIIDMRAAKASNPMGTWVGHIEDVTGATATGWSDDHKKTLMFAFPYPTLVNGYTWTTAAEGVEGDPVRWKLEGSTNGTYWTTLHDQTRGTYATPYGRGEIVGMFSF